MPALRELQSAFRAALLGDDESAITAHVEPDGLSAPARIAIYRHHVLTTLTAALEATYPVVCRLVDRRFFAYAADRYIRQQPPVTPCLFEFGASFADFLRDFPACQALRYLPDVARLEWAMNAALHAADASRLEPAVLRALAAEEIARRPLRLDPSIALLESPWPIAAIWRANQPGADGVVDLDAGGQRLEVRRVDDEVVFHELPVGVFAFRAALAGGRTLEDATQHALAADAAFDVAAAVRALFEDAILVA